MDCFWNIADNENGDLLHGAEDSGKGETPLNMINIIIIHRNYISDYVRCRHYCLRSNLNTCGHYTCTRSNMRGLLLACENVKDVFM